MNNVTVLEVRLGRSLIFILIRTHFGDTRFPPHSKLYSIVVLEKEKCDSNCERCRETV